MNIRLFVISLLVALNACAFAQSKKEVTIWVSRNVAPSAKIRLNVNTKNVPVVHVAAYRINGEQWLRKDEEDRKRPGISGKAVKEWDQTVASKDQRPNPNQADTYYSRQVNLPLLKPGVYLISVTGAPVEAWAVVNVTHLSVVAKRSPKRTLIWVTDALKGQVVPGASVKFFRRSGDLVLSGKTGADGSILLPMTPGAENLVVQRGDDMAGVPTAVEDPNGKLKAHWQTDRPIYRPGQTVYFKSILRRTNDQGYKPVIKQTVKVQIRDPKDNPFDEVTLETNEMGTINGKFEIPEEGQTGPYSLVMTQGKDTDYETFTVAAYRKPEFKVDAKPTEKRWLAGEPVTFEINAAYYFGAPVAQGEVRYTVRRSPISFMGADPYESSFYSGDGNLYPRDTYEANAVVADETGHTDNDGKLRITVPSDPKLGDFSYSIDATVTDASRRVVSASASVPVYAAKIRLGMSTDIYCASLGQLIPITIRSVDLDGRPASAKASITVLTHDWNEKTGKWVEKILTTTSVNVPASGRATFTIPAKESGNLFIRAAAGDGTGRTARAETGVYVSGNFRESKEVKAPEMNLMLDRKFYAPGDSVKAFVTTNRPKWPILVVLEGEDIWSYQVLRTGKPTVTWASKTSLAMSPNAYVTASQWAEGQMLSANKIVPLPDPSRKLQIEATPDKTDYRPGDKATYRIRTLDANGKPLSAEVALSVVDEAIYALSPDHTPDLYNLYWGTRQNLVTMHMSSPEELSGGAYQRVSTVAPVRQRFEDTASWSPTVVTDANGEAEVSFEMPGNLTSWRATARAVTTDTKVGFVRNNVLANRPVMLRLATPRQVVQGDRVTLIGTIDNRSNEERTFTVRLDVESLKLVDGPTREITVPAKKQAKVEWVLDASTLPESGNAELTGQIVAKDDPQNPDLADALRVKLRVVPPGSAERHVLGGVLREEVTAKLDLPTDRLEPASVIRVDVRSGLGPVVQSSASRVLTSGRYSSVAAANQLLVAASLRMPARSKEVREAIAMISRTQASDGWGWWEGAPSDPLITAHVLYALAEAKRSGITVYENMMTAAKESAAVRYARTNLWEHRAVLAASLAFSGDKRGATYLNEVKDRGQNLSPFARLRLASGFAHLGNAGEANELIGGVLKEASTGPSTSYVPVGEGIGWTATDVEATAEALWVLAKLDRDTDLQSQMARWIAEQNEQGYRSIDELAATVRSLNAYTVKHPDARELGDVHVTIGGETVKATPSKFGQMASATLPRKSLKDANEVQIRRTGSGEAFYTIDSMIFRPNFAETSKGIRVIRRYEVRNGAGVWTELNRAVKPGEPVRCTVVTWGDDLSDGLKIVEPIPAGFEFTESDPFRYGREEVRDGAILHYLLNNGTPQTFRYYLRAEAEGKLIGLPATAEYLRRPSTRGQSAAERIEVREVK